MLALGLAWPYSDRCGRRMDYIVVACWILFIASGYALIAFLPPILIGEDRMNTQHASVGYEKDDGTVVGIYVHHDGEVGALGKTLLSMDREDWVEIVNKGDCSWINSDFTAEHYVDEGEPWDVVQPGLFKSDKEFSTWFSPILRCYHSYLLRRDGSKEYASSNGTNEPHFVPLAPAIDRDRDGN